MWNMKGISSSRNKYYLARVSIFLIIVALIAGTAGCDGNPSQNLEIRTWYDLDAVRNNPAGHHVLMNDLDSTTAGYQQLASPTAHGGTGWQPIGTDDAPFTGAFDGKGYKIRELFISRAYDTLGKVGLFGFTNTRGVVTNTHVVNATSIGNGYVGGLVGENHGTVSNSSFTGSVKGDWADIGGLIGCNFGTVNNSYSAASVTGDNGVGGLVGSSPGAVTDSHSTGNVTGMGSVGGLVGNTHGIVINSYFRGNVNGSSSVGGLVGLFTVDGVVTDCYSVGNVTGGDNVGGLIGLRCWGEGCGDDYGGSIVSNSYYDYDEGLINGNKVITIGALPREDFEDWLGNGKFLDVNARLVQEGDYYLVNNVTNLKQLLAFGQNPTLKFRLESDLDLAAEPGFYIPYLAGEFDGNNHRISNLSLRSDFVSSVGLFGCLSSGGKVIQLGIENMDITGLDAVGGLVGQDYEGTVTDCYASGSVTGRKFVGGLVGFVVRGTVTGSYFSGNVTGADRVGGLVGTKFTGSTVNSCYSSGSVTGDVMVGGLVGSTVAGAVSNSYSTGSVTGISSVGGLVGTNSDTVSKSYSTGSVTGGTTDVGGLVGRNGGTVTSSFWDTQTSGQATSGGGIGKTTAQMKNIVTFTGAGWNITAVALNETNPSYIWNIVNNVTYPFLSWQSTE
jgi:hypothetical protein